MDDALKNALELHEASAETFAASAAAVPPERWQVPLNDGKWSPAEVAVHLIAAYDVLLRELRGGAGMEIRTSAWQRFILRFTIVPRVKKGLFPRGARAPRETRPAGPLPRQVEGVALFRERARELVDAALSAPPGQRLTHAYFGVSSLAEGIVVCARHIEHHRRQLP
jgi:hypothetical protein